MYGYNTLVKVILIFTAFLIRVDAYSKLLLGLYFQVGAFVYPFLLETSSFKVSLLAAECECCILGWALVSRMGISVAPDTGFLSL